MTERRRLRSNGRVAHVSLQGQVDADRFIDGLAQRVAVPVADLCAAPDGPRDRQLVLGEVFVCLDHQNGWTFGWAERDGYVGWMASTDLIPADLWTPTHVITAARSYAKSTGGLKTMGDVTPLSFGSRVTVLSQDDGWARIERDHQDPWFLPGQHLTPVPLALTDYVSVAERFLDTPYLWGGNSGFGIDCSGLVQAALLACSLPCPGDSDQQVADLGFDALSGDYRRGDLIFWRGHVAIVRTADTLIHANAHHMSTKIEPIDEAISRISKTDTGPVTAHKRLDRAS